jgi:hypothetical protein
MKSGRIGGSFLLPVNYYIVVDCYTNTRARAFSPSPI